MSIVGVGGFHLSKPDDPQLAIRIGRTASDSGINFLDNSWDYGEGESERRMGQALRDGYREQGKVRYIGFTGHKSPAIHKHTLDVADQHGFRFDALQMPLNVMDAHFDSFEHAVPPVAMRKQIGVLGMKPMGDPFILNGNTVSARGCLSYAMSLPVSVTITGIASLTILKQALDMADSFEPLSPGERAALLARTANAARNGDSERYKVSHHFDRTELHPEWLL